MVLADTSIWIDHFRTEGHGLGHLLARGEVLTHWIVIGELATGNLHNRTNTMHHLRKTTRVPSATELEALALIENQRLFGKGIGWNDLQLLASALIHSVPLWTRDKRLRVIAKKLHISWD